jgi:hypothetical protein
MSIPPDTKDWTWVLERPCPECGLESSSIPFTDVPDILRGNASDWAEVLKRGDVAERPTPSTWSPLEYACHVRDVHEVFDGRYALMLGQDDPLFANWDQDVAAVDGDYSHQQPEVVGPALVAAAQRVAARLAAVLGDAAQRPGRRSNGSRFTVTTLARYHVHDVVHHLHDVRR